MSSVSVARYLLDFASEAEQGRRPPPQPEARIERERAVPREDVVSRADAAQQVDAAYHRGLEDGRVEAAAAAEARLVERLKQHEAERVADRQAWARQEADKLAEGFAKGLKGLETEIASAAARALAPVLFDKARRQALAEMSTLVNEFVSRQHGMSIEVSGPDDLVDELHNSLSRHQIDITPVRGDDCDVQIQCGETVFETQLAALARRIGEAIR